MGYLSQEFCLHKHRYGRLANQLHEVGGKNNCFEGIIISKYIIWSIQFYFCVSRSHQGGSPPQAAFAPCGGCWQREVCKSTPGFKGVLTTRKKGICFHGCGLEANLLGILSVQNVALKTYSFEADPSAPDAQGLTTLHWAAFLGSLRSESLLLQKLAHWDISLAMNQCMSA